MDKKIKVINRAEGSLAYSLPALRINRFFKRSGDYIYVTKEELVELYSSKGGRNIFNKYLQIEDKNVLWDITGMELPPEYDYGEKEIIYLLQEGTDEQFLDCLDFAPQGVKDLLKSLAFSNRPNTTNKIDAINKEFSIDFLRVYENGLYAQEESVTTKEDKNTASRRSTPIKLAEEVKTRRTVTSEDNVATKNKSNIIDGTPKAPKYKVTHRED